MVLSRSSAAVVMAVALAAAASPAWADATIVQVSSPVTGSGTNITGGGVWSWFSDNRAFYDNGNVVAGWMTVDGRVQVGSYNVASNTTTRVNLYNGAFYGADDHNYPAFVKTSDGKYSAFYSQHAINNTKVNYQVSSAPLSATSWGAVQQIPTNTSGTMGTTYSNPFKAPWDATGNTVYNFWRGGDFNPAYAVSTYNPVTGTYGAWSTAATLVTHPSQRPYMKYATNGTDRIGFAFTDAHPDNVDSNSLYFAHLAKDGANVSYFKPGQASAIKTLSSGPITPSQASVIYQDTSPTTKVGNAWVWDTAYTADGRPVVAYSVAKGGAYPHNELRWAIWNGSSWTTKILVADSGGPITHSTPSNPINPMQQYYAGGIAVDPANPFIVYVSAQDPLNANSKFEITQMKLDPSNPAGDVLSTLAVTSNSSVDHFRPVVPEDRPAGVEMVMYNSGTYYNYVNKDTVYYNSSLTNGTGVGYSTTVDLWMNPVATEVPEPASLAVLGLGAAALLGRRRRR